MDLNSKKFFQKGGISFSAIFFYTASFILVLAIPVTVYLLNTTPQQITSNAALSFTSTPTLGMSVSPTRITKGQQITVKISTTNNNWLTLFYSKVMPNDPEILIKQLKSKDVYPDYIVALYKGTYPKDITFTPANSGYLFAASYQLQNYLEDYKSGDLLCGWDNTLYIFRKESSTALEDAWGRLMNERPKMGKWEKIENCVNQAPIYIDVTP